MWFNSADRFFRKLSTSFRIGNKASWLKRKELKPNISRCYRDTTRSKRSKRYYRYVAFVQKYLDSISFISLFRILFEKTFRDYCKSLEVTQKSRNGKRWVWVNDFVTQAWRYRGGWGGYSPPTVLLNIILKIRHSRAKNTYTENLTNTQ